jgi:site-specific DNA-methyltransferase (adenine-specific)
MEELINQIHHTDALTLLNALPANSVDAIVTDPPYFLLGHEWDQQWRSTSEFIEWLRVFVKEFQRVLVPNGSLYIACSHKLQARVEVLIAEYFRVLNNIVWAKSQSTTLQTDRTAMRTYIPVTEHWIFAEHLEGDSPAMKENGYHAQYENAKRELRLGVLADYLADEFARAGASHREIAALFPSRTGNMTGCVSNWLLGYNIPTEIQYHAMREYLNRKSGGQYLRREYEYLRREYEDLRSEYEDLRREYEDLRRAFYLDEAGDNELNVWTFKPPSKRVHPTQKPVAMMEHILRVSTRPGALVLDPFAGSGTTAIAAQRLGRRFIACDMNEEYVQIARLRLQNDDPHKPTVLSNGAKQLSLFDGA